MKAVYLSLGSNLGDREKNLKEALRRLATKFKISAVSGIYETPPLYMGNQPFFYNCAAKALTRASPRELLEEIRKIESKLGRERKIKYGPRTADIDIIFFGNETIKERDLTIPHPLAAEREFVLRPLSEIEPDFVHPVLKKSVKFLLSGLNRRAVRLPDNCEGVLRRLNGLAAGETYDLKRMKSFVKTAGKIKNEKSVYVHVAGSNGKTSTAHFLSRFLSASGLKTGLYTSPHVADPRERIRMGGKKISRKKFFEYFRKANSLGPGLSYFELLTAMALLYFRDEKADCAVMEAGLGGKLDATNVIDADMAVMTRITLEHTAFLGKTVRDISLNKVDILKKGKVLVVSPENVGFKYLEKSAREKKAVVWRPPKLSLEQFPDLPLYQVENCALAAGAAAALKKRFRLKEINLPKMFGAARKFKLEARFETVKRNGRKILIDGAHNPDALAKFFESVKSAGFEKPVCVFSAMNDKNWPEMIEIALGESRKLIVTRVSSWRSPEAAFFRPICRAAAAGRKNFGSEKIVFEKNPGNALKRALEEKGLIAVCGSLYLAAEIKAALRNEKIKFPKEMPMRKAEGGR